MEDKVIYFELNNWFSGRNYPPCEPIASWVHRYQFNKDEWCRENKLCVLAGPIDMSQNWCITAPVEWVEENFPQLLTEERYTYQVMSSQAGSTEWKTTDYDKTYNSFRRYPDSDDEDSVHGQFYWRFLDYEEENYGVHWRNDDGSPDDDDYEEDDDEDRAAL
mgnify:CR=1 FL=1